MKINIKYLVIFLILITWMYAAGPYHTAVKDNGQAQVFTTYVSAPIFNINHSSGSPYSLAGTNGTYWNNTASAFNWQLDVPSAGKQYCFGNYQARSSALTITSTTGVTIYFKGVAGTTTSGTLVSSGAAGDFICLEGTDATTYMAIGAGYGTWTNN